MPIDHSITFPDGPEGHPPEPRTPPPDVTLDHVFAISPDRIMNSVPQFMHVPFVVIAAPPETDPGNTLDASHYRVTSVDVANRRVQLELKVGGTFADPFIKIRGARAEIKGPNGGVIAPFAPGEYSDATYLKADVPIDGLGLHRVTVVGINSIAREGTSYMRVHVGIKKQFADALSNVRREMLRLENGSVPAPGSAGEAVLNSLRAAETSLWQRALEDPAVQIRHVQKGSYDTRVEDAWKFKVRLRRYPQASATALIQDKPSMTETPPKETFLRPVAPQKLLSYRPPDGDPGGKYFVTKPEYDGDWTFETKGILRGKLMELMESRLNNNVLFGSTIFGVAIEGPSCKVLRRSDEYVPLSALGLPDPSRGSPGEYTWDVVTAPKGATWRFEPAGPSPNPATKFFPAVTGRYTVRVTYDIDNIGCPHVHDVLDLDVQVLRPADTRIQLRRLGRYPSELRDHVTRPYYHERCLDTKQGAELLISTPGATMGNVFSAGLRFPAEIRVQDLLTARVYTNAALTEYTDYSGAPYIEVTEGASSDIVVRLDCIDEIHAVHIIRIYYDDLLKLRGQAVKVTVSYKRPDSICPPDLLVEDPVPDTTSWGGISTVAIAVMDEEDGSHFPDDNGPTWTVITRVNLLVFNRDLGDTAVGRADRALDSDEAHHNCANGNVYLPVPVTATRGHGFSASVDLCYNSLHSSYGAALRDLIVYNGITSDELRAEYDAWLLGPGWISSLDMRLFDYVVAEGLENEVLLERMELVSSDGNRIQFERKDPGVYEVLYDSEVFSTDPEVALSLRLETIPDGFLLSDKYANHWKFDRLGRLTEIGDLRTTEGQLKTLRVLYSAASVVIVDSMERRTTMEITNGIVSRIIDPSGNATSFFYKQVPERIADSESFSIVSLLERIVDPIRRARSFEYDDDFYFMLSKVNRRGFATTLAWYSDGAPAGTSTVVAPWFWGRLASFDDGGRALQIKYLERWPDAPAPAGTQGFRPDREQQPVELIDAANVSAFYKLDLDRMSAVEQWVRPKGGGALKRVAKFEFRDETKSLLASSDLWGTQCTFMYEEAQGRPRSRNVKSMSGPAGITSYTYHPTNLVRTLLDAWGGTTTYEYDVRGNLTKAILPEALTATSQAQDSDQTHEIVWVFDEESRLTERTDEAGFRFIPEYGGAGDPGPCGLWTRGRRELVAGNIDASQTLNDDYEYDRNGFAVKSSDAATGRLLTYDYDAAGRLREEKLQGIWTDGAVSEHVTTFVRNEHDDVTSLQDNLGRVDRMRYDRYDREEWRQIRSGATLATLEWDGHANPTKVRDLTGRVKTYEYDELDRLTKVQFPAPEGRNEQHAEFTRTYDDTTAKVVEKQGTRSTTFTMDGAQRITQILYDEGGGPERKIVFTYAAGEDPATVERFADGTSLNKTTVSRDRRGRIRSIAQTGGGMSATTYVTRDAMGRVARVRPPDYTASPSGRPEIFNEYDGIGRRIRTYESYGRVVEELEFDDAAKSVVVKRPDPQQTETGTAAPRLVQVSRQLYDARGNATEEETLGSRVTYNYDVAGRLRRVIDQDGNLVVENTYTAMDLLRTVSRPVSRFITAPNGSTRVVYAIEQVRYDYNDMSNLVRLTPPQGATVEYRYDEMGRRSQELRGGTVYLDIAYDSLGRIKSIIDAEGGEHTVQYFEAEQRVSVTWINGADIEERTYKMDAAGWLSGFESSVSPVALSYDHSSWGRISETIAKSGSSELGRITYEYDDVGNRIGQRLRTAGGVLQTRYSHDANGRLTAVNPPYVGAVTLRYNPAGLLQQMNRSTTAADNTNFSYNNDAKLSRVAHRFASAAGVAAMLSDSREDHNTQGNPLSLRNVASLGPNTTSQIVSQQYTVDGKNWKQTIEERITAQNIRLAVTRETTFARNGLPLVDRVVTRVVEHPQLLRDQESRVTTVTNYRADQRVGSVTRSVVDFDGQTVDTNVQLFRYDSAGILRRSTTVRTNELNHRLTQQYRFVYDSFRRLAGVDMYQASDSEALRPIKAVTYFYGPNGEMLGESRRYLDPALQQFVESKESLKRRPNPTYYLNDESTRQAELAADGRIYSHTVCAPGGNYPILTVDRAQRAYYPHQDADGTTQLFTRSNGRLHAYLPQTLRDQQDQTARAAVQGAHHRLGDAGLETSWPVFVSPNFPMFSYLGDNLPFDLIPTEVSDASSFADAEFGQWGEDTLGRRSILETLSTILRGVVLLPYYIISGVSFSVRRRYQEFTDLGASAPAVQALSSGIGDFIGYTDLLEGIVGVDLATSSELSTGRRWFKGILGTVSLLTLGAGSMLKVFRTLETMGPVSRWARYAQGNAKLMRSWEVGTRGGTLLQIGMVGADLAATGLSPSRDQLDELESNSVSILKRIGRGLWDVVPFLPTGNSARQQFIRLVADLYEEGIRRAPRCVSWQMLGTLADDFVKEAMRNDPAVLRRLSRIGVRQQHIDFASIASLDGRHNVDVIWTKGKVALELKLSIDLSVRWVTKRSRQERAHIKAFQGRRYWFGYISAFVKPRGVINPRTPQI